MSADLPTAGGVPEFPVKFGFTRDVTRFGGGSLEYSGLAKVTPRAVGIYRTGDAYGFVLGLIRAAVYSRFPSQEDSVARPADVAPNTDGTPEHVIDAKRMTLLVDEKRRLIILQVPGSTHFVLRARRHGATPSPVVEAELIAALERCAGARAQSIACRLDYMASIPFILLVAVVAIFFVTALTMLFTW